MTCNSSQQFALVGAMCAAALAAALYPQSSLAEPATINRPFLPPKQMDKGSFRCSAHIVTEPSVVPRNGRARLRCEVRCTASGGDVFNPFLFDQASHIPAQIVITSADGQFRRELLRPAERAGSSCPTTLWQNLSSFRSVGQEIDLRIGPTSTAGAAPTGLTRYVDLPPGQYCVQAIYNHWLVASRPEDPRMSDEVQIGPRTDNHIDNPERLLFPGIDMDSPLLVSEAVKLDVTPETGSQAVDRDADSFPLRPELRLRTARAVLGRTTEIEIGFTNRSSKHLQTYDLYLNPFLILLSDFL